MNLLRRWEIGPFFRSFLLNRTRYSPQMIEKLSSISHSPRYDPLKSDRLLALVEPAAQIARRAGISRATRCIGHRGREQKASDLRDGDLQRSRRCEQLLVVARES